MKRNTNKIAKLIKKTCPLTLQYLMGYPYLSFIGPCEWGYGRYNRFHAFLNESQWWKRQQLESYQLRELKNMLRYVYHYVPYYRKIFLKRGLTPADFNSLNDLVNLPILTRDEVTNNFDKLIARNIPIRERNKRFHLQHNSGSTGAATKYLLDNKYIFKRFAWRHWSLEMIGLSKYDRYVRLYSVPFIKDAINDIKFHMPQMRRLALSTLPCSEYKFEEYLFLIKKFRPKYIIGWPSFIYALAYYVKNKNIKDIMFLACISYGEKLHVFQRKLIEQQFQCRVFNQYSSEEALIYAIECDKHQGMHVDSRMGITEIVNSKGESVSDGRWGRIIATGFSNYVMPLIRYDLGDIGVISPNECGCGRSLPVLASIEGRTSEMIHFNKQYISPTALGDLLKQCKNMKEFQFVRESHFCIMVNVVRKSNYSLRDRDELIQNLKDIFGDKMQVKINFVDSILKTKKGKFQLVIDKTKA